MNCPEWLPFAIILSALPIMGAIFYLSERTIYKMLYEHYGEKK